MQKDLVAMIHRCTPQEWDDYQVKTNIQTTTQLIETGCKNADKRERLDTYNLREFCYDKTADIQLE